MPRPETTTALLTAIHPIAAYVARTPAGNAHADRCAALVDAVADYVDEAAAADFEPPAPDWEVLALRMAAYIEPTAPPSPIAARTRAHLDTLTARAARPLPERMAAARLISHHLGLPATF